MARNNTEVVRKEKNNVKEKFDSFQQQISEGEFKGTNDFLKKLLKWADENKIKGISLKDMIYKFLDEIEYFVTDLDRAVEKLEVILDCKVYKTRNMKDKVVVSLKKGGKKSSAFITLDFKKWGFNEMIVGELFTDKK